jgi:enamine deaminase RidA (YjgF/YER057c/UK114 family)
MRPPTIHRTPSNDAASSVVDLAGVRHLFAHAAPQGGGDFQQQARDALRTIQAVARDEGASGSIVHQTIFMSDLRQAETCRQIVRDFYGDHLPATSYIPQPPCGGELLTIEVLGIAHDHGGVELRRLSERIVTAHYNGLTWVYCANVFPETSSEIVYDRSMDAFRRLEGELVAGGFCFDQVVRTWLYLGDITGLEASVPRYQKLNLARTDFFQDRRFLGDDASGRASRVSYPASTGVGAVGRDVMMSCLALATDRPDVLRVALENPRQVAAHDYDHRYGRQSPKFSRAMAIVDRDLATVLVSGTASIIDSESHHIDDVARQTHETLDNIAALISADNFGNHGQAGLGATLDDLAFARAYVKRAEDYAVVRDACRARLGDVPVVYTVADMCRPELLVEIEGIAFCGR